ncbi:unnamed protein product [Cyclocybe aegerita]|uniref:Uncharacterized protein n=1 Tax=Cyclocybe aegerita TaxID=1973307 RepID=A0A8S0WZ39_CYCAE|nr:unnamed protein product [Cyclocybe aegerita]
MSSPSPSPRSRLSSRMGGTARRTSTLLSIARLSPSKSRANGHDEGSENEAASRRRTVPRPTLPSLSDLTVPPPASVHEVHLPSPIAESPAREVLATQKDVVRPAPLSPTWATVETAPGPAPVRAETAEDSPVVYTPSPVGSLTAGSSRRRVENAPEGRSEVGPTAGGNLVPSPAPKASQFSVQDVPNAPLLVPSTSSPKPPPKPSGVGASKEGNSPLPQLPERSPSRPAQRDVQRVPEGPSGAPSTLIHEEQLEPPTTLEKDRSPPLERSPTAGSGRHTVQYDPEDPASWRLQLVPSSDQAPIPYDVNMPREENTPAPNPLERSPTPIGTSVREVTGPSDVYSASSPRQSPVPYAVSLSNSEEGNREATRLPRGPAKLAYARARLQHHYTDLSRIGPSESARREKTKSSYKQARVENGRALHTEDQKDGNARASPPAAR